MKMTEQLRSDLIINGWVEIQNISSDDELLNISNHIGQIVPQRNGHMIFTLTPTEGENSTKGTFSNRYGFNPFPLHTDAAFWTIPIRYILLSSAHPSCCNTILVSVNSLLNRLENNDKKNALKAIFKVRTTHSQFYSSLFFNENNVSGVRYDSTCMFPANNSAKLFTLTMNELEIPEIRIQWTGKNAIIIDNWRMLHGRNTAFKDEKRELKRIYIN
jgi:alpha-ketoglutarate-dependent taurine dioxygenase